MNFDFSWFLTIPGMLITGGVLLLIIALIILIVTSSKKKKDQELPTDNINDGMQPQINQPNGIATEPGVMNGEALPEMNSPIMNNNDSIMNIPQPIPMDLPNQVPVDAAPMMENIQQTPETITPPTEMTTPYITG